MAKKETKFSPTQYNLIVKRLREEAQRAKEALTQAVKGDTKARLKALIDSGKVKPNLQLTKEQAVEMLCVPDSQYSGVVYVDGIRLNGQATLHALLNAQDRKLFQDVANHTDLYAKHAKIDEVLRQHCDKLLFGDVGIELLAEFSSALKAIK